MRLGRRLAIVVLVVALIGVIVATGAAAATDAEGRQPTEATEAVILEPMPRKEVHIFVEVHPLLGIAVVKTYMGPLGGARPHGRWGTVNYAARIPAGPAEGRLDVEIPGIATIDGELVSTGHDPGLGDCKGEERGSEDVDFQGSVEFHGNGGYLDFDAQKSPLETSIIRSAATWPGNHSSVSALKLACGACSAWVAWKTLVRPGDMSSEVRI
jgi:hypothetical protein